MSKKHTVSIFRTDLVNVGLGQGQRETVPYLYRYHEYDREGRMTEQSIFSPEGILTERISWEFNELGQVTRESYFTDEGEASEIKIFEYAPHGKVEKEVKHYIDGSSDTTTWLYDNENRLIEKTTVTDEEEIELKEIFIYQGPLLVEHRVSDGENELISLEELQYDENGRLIEQHTINEENGEDYRTRMLYDETGFKIAGQLFDSNGRLLESVRYEPDENGRLIAMYDESPGRNIVTHYYYDQLGNQAGHEEINHQGEKLVWAEHTYDNTSNPVTSLVFVNGGGRTLSQHYELKYEYEWYDN